MRVSTVTSLSNSRILPFMLLMMMMMMMMLMLMMMMMMLMMMMICRRGFVSFDAWYRQSRNLQHPHRSSWPGQLPT